MPSGISPYAIAVAATALAAGVLMLLTEVTTVVSIDLTSTTCERIYDTNPELADSCSQEGFERHGPALLLLGLLTFAMGFGAAFGRSRPAAGALIGIGVVVLALTLLRDLPASDDTGLVGRQYDQARAQAGAGLWFELVGGALAVLAGVLRVVRRED